MLLFPANVRHECDKMEHSFRLNIRQTPVAGRWTPTVGSDWQLEKKGGNGMTHACPAEIKPRDQVLASSYMTCGVSMVSCRRSITFIQAVCLYRFTLALVSGQGACAEMMRNRSGSAVLADVSTSHCLFELHCQRHVAASSHACFKHTLC